jgi:hypothetical protein
MRRLPGPAIDRPGEGGDSRGSLRFVSGLAVNTDLIYGADSPRGLDRKWMSGSAPCRNHPPRGTHAQRMILTDH